MLAALRVALGEIVRRHEVLRTRFESGADRLLQIVGPATARKLPVVDLERAGEIEARRLAEREIARAFDLRTGPLARFALLRLAPAEHVLLVSQHHIVFDDWSAGLVYRGRPPP